MEDGLDKQHQRHPKSNPKANAKTKPKTKLKNPIARVVEQWLSDLPDECASFKDASRAEALIAACPRRYTTYEPMALLPSGSFNGDTAWKQLLEDPRVTDRDLDTLWKSILAALPQTRAAPLTHLAVNEGIPPQTLANRPEMGNQGENVLRSPNALRPLHGDFGPSRAPHDPSEQDFADAFWVSTKQLGVFQTWAPRWTMFSRGNVKEKERLLSFHHHQPLPEHLAHRSAVALSGDDDAWVVDMYAGIGYFTFMYAKQGARVACWELNPWSVEALRRGAVENGWSVRMVEGDELCLPTQDLVGDEQIVVFLEDNREAGRRISEIRASWKLGMMNIVHVNCGLLPTSEPTWRPAWDMAVLNSRARCWLHLHENVGVEDIERRRVDMQKTLDGWAEEATEATETPRPGHRHVAHVEHVELVKTYAPGVWHCVFDVCIANVVIPHR